MPLRKKRNFKNLTLGNSPVVVSQPEAVPDKRRSSVRRLEEEYDRLCEKIKDLEPGLELRLDLRPDDFENVDELGRGNGGTVCKVLHVRTNTVMAKKVSKNDKMYVCMYVFISSISLLGYSRRGQYECSKTNHARTSIHARLQLSAHCQLLWCVHEWW